MLQEKQLRYFSCIFFFLLPCLFKYTEVSVVLPITGHNGRDISRDVWNFSLYFNFIYLISPPFHGQPWGNADVWYCLLVVKSVHLCAVESALHEFCLELLGFPFFSTVFLHFSLW
jgi:hypothetical protein